MTNVTSGLRRNSRVPSPLYRPVRRLTLFCDVSKPESALDHVWRPISVVPIRTSDKWVSRPEEERGGSPLPPLGDQIRTRSSTVSGVVAAVRLNDIKKSTTLLACEAARKMNFESPVMASSQFLR